MKASRWGNVVYYSLWTMIVAVSVHDGYLVLLNRWTIAVDEQNPLGRCLIAADSGDIRFLLAAKTVGTIAAAAVLLVLFWKQPRLAWVVCVVLALLQLWLVVHLTVY
jgi:hypothetical protein